jgi:hypothetical protein
MGGVLSLFPGTGWWVLLSWDMVMAMDMYNIAVFSY